MLFNSFDLKQPLKLTSAVWITRANYALPSPLAVHSTSLLYLHTDAMHAAPCASRRPTRTATRHHLFRTVTPPSILAGLTFGEWQLEFRHFSWYSSAFRQTQYSLS